MKLYELKWGSMFKVVDRDVVVPPGAPEVNTGDVIKLNTIDGMYSHCTNSKGETVHLAAWTEVESAE